MSLSQAISQTDSLLDERQVARMIGMSVGSLRRWRLLGQGPPFLRVGRRGVRYKPEHLALWLDSRPIGGSDVPAPPMSAPESGDRKPAARRALRKGPRSW